MKNDETGHNSGAPLGTPAKKVWKSPELAVISANDINLKPNTWAGSGDAGEPAKAPAFYKRVKKILPFKGDD
jgi:hypothetical protein